MPLKKMDAAHWRERAEEMRALAAVANDREAREAMLKIAQDYDRLAERAELQKSRAPLD